MREHSIGPKALGARNSASTSSVDAIENSSCAISWTYNTNTILVLVANVDSCGHELSSIQVPLIAPRRQCEAEVPRLYFCLDACPSKEYNTISHHRHTQRTINVETATKTACCSSSVRATCKP